MYAVILSRQALKDKVLIKQAGLAEKAKAILDILMADPFRRPPGYEKLQGDLHGYYSRRINIKHRLVYTVDEQMQVVHVLRMWSHYE